MQSVFHGSRSCSQEFLLYKSDSREDEQKSSETLVVSEEFQKRFPDKSSGKLLIESAMTVLDSSLTFAVMLIRSPMFFLEAAKIADDFCRQERAVWGIAEQHLLACFFPDKSVESAFKLAHKLIGKLPLNQNINIGIAGYPQANFSRDRIIENARKALEHAAISGPGKIAVFDAVSLNISGDKFYQEGHIHKAIEEFKTALLLDPSNVNIHNSLGVCYGALGAHKSALEEFETAIQIAPNEVMAHYNAGLVTLLMADTEKALIHFSNAAQTGEDVFEVYFQLGKLHLKSEKPENAKEFLGKATVIKPDSVSAWRYLGECCTALNLTEEAIKAYKKAVKLNPSDAESLSALGELFILQGENPDIAIAFCQHSIEITQDNGLFRHRLGLAYFKQNRLEEALKEFQKAIECGYDSSEFIEKISDIRDYESIKYPITRK